MGKNDIRYLVPTSFVTFGVFCGAAAMLHAIYLITSSLKAAYSFPESATIIGACFLAGASLPWFFISQRSTINRREGSPSFSHTFDSMSSAVKSIFVATLVALAIAALITLVSANKSTQKTAISVLYLCGAMTLTTMSFQWNISWQVQEFRRKFKRFLR